MNYTIVYLKTECSAGDMVQQSRALLPSQRICVQWPAPHGGSESSITPLPENPKTSSDACRHQECMWYTDMQTNKTFMHTKQNKLPGGGGAHL